MRNWKKMMGLTAAVCLTMSLLGGCGKDEPENTNGQTKESAEESSAAQSTETESAAEVPTDPLEAITYGRYVYTFSAEGHGDFVNYFHFYEEDPVLGAVFYAGFANNQSNFVGTYEVLEESIDYSCSANREEAVTGVKHDGTAPYTIVFYDWQGNEMDRCGYDGETIYNTLKNITSLGSSDIYYAHDTDLKGSKFASSYEAEMGVPYLDFIGAEDPSITLQLFHNMTYMDLVDMIVEGSWSMEVGADGSTKFTLVPADSADTGAVVTVSADKASAQYKADGASEEIALVNSAVAEPEVSGAEAEAEVLFSFTGTYTTLDCLADGTYVFGFEAQGLTETGTWTWENWTFSLTQEGGNVITAVMDENSHALQLEYVAEINDQLKDTFTCEAAIWGAALTQ